MTTTITHCTLSYSEFIGVVSVLSVWVSFVRNCFVPMLTSCEIATFPLSQFNWICGSTVPKELLDDIPVYCRNQIDKAGPRPPKRVSAHIIVPCHARALHTDNGLFPGRRCWNTGWFLEFAEDDQWLSFDFCHQRSSFTTAQWTTTACSQAADVEFFIYLFFV